MCLPPTSLWVWGIFVLIMHQFRPRWRPKLECTNHLHYEFYELNKISHSSKTDFKSLSKKITKLYIYIILKLNSMEEFINCLHNFNSSQFLTIMVLAFEFNEIVVSFFYFILKFHRISTLPNLKMTINMTWTLTNV